MSTTSSVYHCHVISDSLGNTAYSSARAVLAQFPQLEIIVTRHQFVTTPEQFDKIIASTQDKQAFVMYTVVDAEFSQYIQTTCQSHQIVAMDLLLPYIDQVALLTDSEPKMVTGAQHELSENYFRRIKAMEFSMHYDDAQDTSGILEADIVLLGISRTGKTPLSMYLATMGYKVVNIPLFPENELPEELDQIDRKKIIGLTNSEDVVNRHRVTRMREYGMSEQSRYASIERVRQELEYSNEVYEKFNCPVINVSDKSIEESASIIVQLLRLPDYQMD